MTKKGKRRRVAPKRKSKPVLGKPKAVRTAVDHGPRCPLNPARAAMHGREIGNYSCTCEWDENGTIPLNGEDRAFTFGGPS